jgi:hypothetical protein
MAHPDDDFERDRNRGRNSRDDDDDWGRDRRGRDRDDDYDRGRRRDDDYDDFDRRRGRGTEYQSSDLTALEWILCILCSGIGCIVGIVYLCQGNPKGGKMIGFSILFAIIGNVIVYIATGGKGLQKL